MATETTASAVRSRLLDYLAEDVECEVLASDDSRIGCVTPLLYGDGDAVVVWVRESGGVIEVTDYGESLGDAAGGAKKERKQSDDLAREVAFSAGVHYFEGRLSSECQLGELGEHVWRVASASALLAQTLTLSRPKSRKESDENEFVKIVETTMRSRHVPVEKEHRLVGDSGHKHKATLYVPITESVIEPVAGHWNSVASLYTKFGDLSRANGYNFYSLVDDRTQQPDEDVGNLLIQVSTVLPWSAHDDWLSRFSSSGDT